MYHVLYIVLSLVWIYFFGWVFLGSLFTKVLPGPTVAKIAGAVVGFLTAGTVVAILLHLL